MRPQDIAWSWTVLERYEECPKRHFFLKVSRQVKDKKGEALIRGQVLHECLAAWLVRRGNLSRKQAETIALEVCQREKATALDTTSILKETWPLVLRCVGRMGELLAIPGEMFVEQSWAFARDLREVSGTEWGAVYVRVALDVLNISPSGRTALVTDWKSGKREPGPGQMMLYAVVTMLKYPAVERVVCRMVYVDKSDLPAVEETFTRDQLQSMLEHLFGRAYAIEYSHATGMWPAKPTKWGCTYCPAWAICDAKHADSEGRAI